MQSIGIQKKLPMKTTIEISLQGIKLRLGRALITLFGVILGMAFLMSVLTGDQVKSAVAEQQALRETAALMRAVVD